MYRACYSDAVHKQTAEKRTFYDHKKKSCKFYCNSCQVGKSSNEKDLCAIRFFYAKILFFLQHKILCSCDAGFLCFTYALLLHVMCDNNKFLHWKSLNFHKSCL